MRFVACVGWNCKLEGMMEGNGEEGRGISQLPHLAGIEQGVLCEGHTGFWSA